MSDEKGYIKYQCNWVKKTEEASLLTKELNEWRFKLYKLGFIGVYPNGIGYGNISIRLHGSLFLITGSATGAFENLTAAHYTKVTAYDFASNSLTCEGPIQASSESLTHAAVYESDSEIGAVIHIHSRPLWDELLYKIPTTSPEVEYGTPQMAAEIKRLFKDTDLCSVKILAMGGHEEGIIAFGKDLEEAGRILLALDNI
jgi:L-ribulose-5-phosphate 4-epimerase